LDLTQTNPLKLSRDPIQLIIDSRRGEFITEIDERTVLQTRKHKTTIINHM